MNITKNKPNALRNLLSAGRKALLPVATILFALTIWLHSSVKDSLSKAVSVLPEIKVSAPSAPVAKQPVAPPVAPPRTELTAQERAQLQRIYTEAVTAFRAEVMDNQADFEAECTDAFAQFESEFLRMAERMAKTNITAKGVAQLVLCTAEDTVRRDDKNREEEWVEANLLFPLIDLLPELNEDLGAALAKWESRLNMSITTLNNSVLDAVQNLIKGTDLHLSPEEAFAKAFGSTSGTSVSLQAGILAVAIPLDIAALSAANRKALTKLIAKIVTKIYQKTFKRLLSPAVQRAVASIGAILVDGPIPIGDIVAAGLLAWTVYDVATFIPHLRRDYISGMQEGVRQMQLQLETNIYQPTRAISAKLRAFELKPTLR